MKIQQWVRRHFVWQCTFSYASCPQYSYTSNIWWPKDGRMLGVFSYLKFDIFPALLKSRKIDEMSLVSIQNLTSFFLSLRLFIVINHFFGTSRDDGSERQISEKKIPSQYYLLLPQIISVFQREKDTVYFGVSYKTIATSPK